MMPAAKHFDPVLGVDIHIIQPPGPVPPVPIPHPFIGFVIDPCDYAPFIGSTVKINSLHRAQAGTAGKCVPPHIPIGGVFVKPPENECEVFMGSATVCVDGDAQSYLALPALSCHDVGMVPPPRPKKKSKVKSMVLPTSVVLPIPAGPPVLIGGPPTISLMALGMRVGLAALGKLFKKLAKTKRFRRFKKKVKAKFKSKRKPGHHKSCGRPGEPVDVWTGANVDDFLDYQLPGPIAFEWKRFYDSTRAQENAPLGRGFRHGYQRELCRTSSGFQYIDPEGDCVEFDPFPAEAKQTASDGILLSLGNDGIYRLAEAEAPTMEFRLDAERHSAPLSALVSRHGRIELQYDSLGRLGSLRTSRGEFVRFRYNATNHVSEVSVSGLNQNQTPVRLASYEYDQYGNLIRWIDALGNTAEYAYDDQHRMRKKTDRNGYSYHYRYDSLGRCIHTWGDDGLYDVRLEYFPEALLTVATYGDSAEFTYIFDEQGTLVEIADPVGGSTKFLTDDAGNVTAEIDPAGNKTLFQYDAWGGHTRRIAPTGHLLPPMHVQPQQPDVLAYELPRTPVEWEWGTLLAGQISEVPQATDRVLQEFPLIIAAEELRVAGPAQQAGLPRETRDAMGRLVECVDYQGRRERWQYDKNGNLVAYHDPDGRIHGRRIASWNLMRQAVDPLGNATRFDYSLREQITKVVDAGETTSEFLYDGCDRLVQVTRHGSLRERYEYDAGGNLVRKTDGHGATMLEFEPGPFGLAATCTLASGGKQQFTSDDKGRLIKAASPGAELAFQYDWSGRISSDLRNKRGVKHEVAPSEGRVTIVLEKFRIVQRMLGPGEFSIQDPTGMLHRFRLSRGGLLSRQLGNGTRELVQYDGDGRCLRKIAVPAGQRNSPWSRRFDYSPGGDLLACDDSQQGLTRYEYDEAHRLIGESTPGAGTNRFAYDRANNLVAQPGLAGVELATGNRLKSANGCQFEYNHRNHVAVKHMPAGEVQYEYDSLDQLVRIESGDGEWTAAYDPLGRRICKRWAGRTIEFHWDDDRLAAEVHDGKRVRVYIYANISSWAPFMFVDYDSLDADPLSGKQYFLFTNAIGTPVLVEDQSGNAVWRATVSPYGQVDVAADSTIEQPLRFPGHHLDEETGLFYNRFRYYDPVLGRYLQSDPLGIAGGINVYAYPNNPLTNVDLQGLHGKSHGKGKGKRKGGAKAESTSVRNADSARPDPKKMAGMTDEAFGATCRIAKEHDVKIRVRPSNPDCLDWIKKGNPKKPEFIKNKTINEMDELMGPPPAPGTKGLVGHFEPPPRDAAIKRAEDKLGRELTDAEKEALEKRRADRLTEYHRNDGELRHEKGDKVTVDDQKGVLVDNRPGDTQGKEFTGDHDMFDIQQKGPDGQWHPADPAKKDAVVNDMKNDPNVQAQHGDHKSWDYDPNDKQARDIDKAVLESHQAGGKPLVDFNPDSTVGTSHYDGPVP